MIYISYYTPGDYEKVFETRLHPTLHRWNLDHDVEVLKDKGSWNLNTHYKAEFIKKMLLKHKQSIVFLDVDATIEDYPMLLAANDIYCNNDIALHYLDWYLLWKKEKGCGKREALSGTLYLRYNEKVLKFLDDWIEENNRSSSFEQKNMATVLEENKYKLKIYKLPPEYCCIIMRDNSIPIWYIEEKPVIIHWQASRQLKNKR